jgi:hypothetical protein
MLAPVHWCVLNQDPVMKTDRHSLLQWTAIQPENNEWTFSTFGVFLGYQSSESWDGTPIVGVDKPVSFDVLKVPGTNTK